MLGLVDGERCGDGDACEGGRRVTTTTGDAQSEVMGLLRGVLVAMHAAATAAASGHELCGHNGVAALGHLALEERVQAVVRKPLLDCCLLELVHVHKAALHHLAPVHCVVGCRGSGDDGVDKALMKILRRQRFQRMPVVVVRSRSPRLCRRKRSIFSQNENSRRCRSCAISALSVLPFSRKSHRTDRHTTMRAMHLRRPFAKRTVAASS